LAVAVLDPDLTSTIEQPWLRLELVALAERMLGTGQPAG